MLYCWKERFEAQLKAKVLSEDERGELKLLSKENQILRMETEILKKASAFFVKEMGLVQTIPSTTYCQYGYQ